MHKPTFTIRPKTPRWRRILLACVALPPVLLLFLALSAAYHIYASNKALAEERRFPAIAAPVKTQRLLVFAPHCDDETLGAAGLMRQARRAGADVHVVILSNGDGFRVGVESEYKEIRVTPADYVRYAYHRQTESRTALHVLGVEPDCVTFLGYPDRGLMPLWTTNWALSHPFRSVFTNTDHSPYANSPTPHAAYAGEVLLSDIERQMMTDKPTDIYVTHPNDDHPDHAAASVFVQTALQDLKRRKIAWAQTSHLHFYLVHRGDWPCPQGLHEDFALSPPAPLAALDTRWEQLPLTIKDIHAKYAAIKRYPSQTELTGRFLYSFVRQNELFGTLPGADATTLPRIPGGRLTLAGPLSQWNGIIPIALDPAGDTVLRAFQASGDITRVFACRDNRWLFLRLDAHQALSPRVTYSFDLRPVRGNSAAPAFTTLSIRPVAEGQIQSVPGLPGATSVWQGASLVVRVPLSSAGLGAVNIPETLYVQANTRFAGLPVDKTGFRALGVNTSPIRAASR